MALDAYDRARRTAAASDVPARRRSSPASRASTTPSSVSLLDCGRCWPGSSGASQASVVVTAIVVRRGQGASGAAARRGRVQKKYQSRSTGLSSTATDITSAPRRTTSPAVPAPARSDTTATRAMTASPMAWAGATSGWPVTSPA